MTVESIREDEDFLEDRPLLVVGYGDKFIVFAGNLRLTASRKLKLNDVPCVIYEPEDDVTDPQTIRRRALKDNGSAAAGPPMLRNGNRPALLRRHHRALGKVHRPDRKT